MAFRGEDFAREAGAAPDVEDEGRAGEREEGERAVGHRRLDIANARGGGIFAGFGVIVEEVGRTMGGGAVLSVTGRAGWESGGGSQGVFWPGHGGVFAIVLVIEGREIRVR